MHLGSCNASNTGFSYKRRLVMRLYALVHLACDVNDLTVAQDILSIIDKLLLSSSFNPEKQRYFAHIHVAAHERLWALHHKVP